MTRYHQPRIGPDRRVRDRRAKPVEAVPPARPPSAIRVRWPLVVVLAAALGAAAFIEWTRTSSAGSPLDRAEALCRGLARSPQDSLAAGLRSDIELRRGRFAPHTPPAPVLRQALGIDEPRVLRCWTQRVGDYDVAAMWVRLPGTDRHALAVAWIESAGLAICRFDFPGRGATLSADEVERGDDLLDRILVPGNFRAHG